MVHDHARQAEQRVHHCGEPDRSGEPQLRRDGVCAGEQDEEMGCGLVVEGPATDDGEYHLSIKSILTEKMFVSD